MHSDLIAGQLRLLEDFAKWHFDSDDADAEVVFCSDNSGTVKLFAGYGRGGYSFEDYVHFESLDSGTFAAMMKKIKGYDE